MAAPAGGVEIEDDATAASRRKATRTVVDAARLGASAFGRPDLAQVLDAALARIDRAETLVAVMGEYKQGKSALVNALLGHPAAVVDDDVATVVPILFRYGSAWTASAWPAGATGDGETENARQLTPESYRELVTAALGPESPAKRLDQPGSGMAVSVTVPSALLESGLMLLDSPAVGGLSTTAGGLVLGYLRSVDALVYVADASAPLDRPRLDLLKQAANACPALLVVMTKVDLYGEWRRILEINRQALAAEGIDAPIVAVSASLMERADEAGDDELANASGIPELRQLLASVASAETRAESDRRGLDEASFVIDQLLSSAHDELAALENPDASAERSRELEEARARLAHLRGPGARWSQVLADRFGDHIGDADHRFRGSVRETARELDERLEQLDPARDWPPFATWLQERAGSASDLLLREVGAAAREAEQAVRDVLREERGMVLELVDAAPRLSFGHDRLREPKGIEKPTLRTHAGLLMSAVKGGQSGFFSLSFIAGLAGITLSGVATAGIGLVFAGRQVLDERRRQLQTRRQHARAVARRYLEDVEFVTSKQSRDLARDLQRRLREHFLEQFTQLQQTCAESLATIETAAHRDEEDRRRRAAELRERIDQLSRLAQAAAPLPAEL